MIDIGNYKQVGQGKQGRIFEIILVYIEKNYDEVWHSNTKFRIFKEAHWKIYRWNKVN